MISQNIMAITDPQKFLQSLESKSIINRLEAKSRLEELSPTSEEHCKLQRALIRTGDILEVSLPTHSYKVNTSIEGCGLLGGFGSSEHMEIGEQVTLKGIPDEDKTLFRRGVTSVRFHHIVALAGDFYGVANEAISLPPGTANEKIARFKKAYNTMVDADNDEIRRIILEIEQECTAVKHSGLPHHCYSSQLIAKNNAIKKIKKDIDLLLIDNSDHFHRNAEEAYEIGHGQAMKVAKEAGKTKNVEKLKEAYAMDAFACHFLTDLFSSGHVDNPRGNLEIFLVDVLQFSVKNAKLLAGILTGAQHERDGKDGLNVCNRRGDKWRAYGDGSFFSPKNAQNKEQVFEAVQQSVQEVYDAFCSPDSDFLSTMPLLFPHATDLNPPPLYSIRNGSLLLHRGSKEIKIQTKKDYITLAIPHALQYLPEEYISGFITPHTDLEFPVFSKVIAPQVLRLTGGIWRIVGVSTYHQVKQANKQVNAKMDEMASVLKETNHNTTETLKKIDEINSKLDLIVWNQLFNEVQACIVVIKNKMHQFENCKATINRSMLIETERELFSAYSGMSRVFCEGTADGRHVVAIYSSMVAASNPSMSSEEVKLAVTLWFRQMLEYQDQAFYFSKSIEVMRQGYPEMITTGYQDSNIRDQVSDLNALYEKQIEKNKDYIDENLIYESQGYIALQLEKSKTRRLALLRFQEYK